MKQIIYFILIILGTLFASKYLTYEKGIAKDCIYYRTGSESNIAGMCWAVEFPESKSFKDNHSGWSFDEPVKMEEYEKDN